MSKVAERLVKCLGYNAKYERVVFVQTEGEDYELLSTLVRSLEVDEDMAYEETLNALEAIAAQGLECIEVDYYDYCEPDIYDHDLLEWVGKNANNVAWCDEALSEFGRPDSLVALIQQGQGMAQESVWRAVIELVREEEEED